MEKKASMLLMIAILLLGINIGLILSSKQIGIESTAHATSPQITANGATIFTCSEDGKTLYRWASDKTSQADNNPLSAFSYTAR